MATSDQDDLNALVSPYLFVDAITARYPVPHLAGAYVTGKPSSLAITGVLRMDDTDPNLPVTRHSLVDRFEELLTALHVCGWVLTEVPDLDLRASLQPAIWTLDDKVVCDEKIYGQCGEVSITVTRCRERLTGN